MGLFLEYVLYLFLYKNMVIDFSFLGSNIKLYVFKRK